MDRKLVMAWYWIDMSIAVNSQAQKGMEYVLITDTVEKNNDTVFNVGLLCPQAQFSSQSANLSAMGFSRCGTH